MFVKESFNVDSKTAYTDIVSTQTSYHVMSSSIMH